METSLSAAAAFLQAEAGDPVALLAKLEQQIQEWEALARNEGGRVNRLRLMSAKRALEAALPWLPGVRLFAELAALGSLTGEERETAGARLRREKLRVAIDALPEGDERRLLRLGWEDLTKPPVSQPAPVNVEVSPPVPPVELAPPVVAPPVESPAAVPLPSLQFIGASHVTLRVGEPVNLPLVTEPPAIAFAVQGLPSALAYSPQGNRLLGTPTEPGDYSVTVLAFAPGLHASQTLHLRVTAALAPPPVPVAPPSSPAPVVPLPPVPPVEPTPPAHPPARPLEQAPVERCSLLVPNGSRLHVFTGETVRLGRNDESDCPVVAIVLKDPAATKALNGEISRKHAELSWQQGRLWVRDGWSDGLGRSKFGTFVDRYEVSTQGVPLHEGQTLRLTQRTEGTAPAWRVRLFPPLPRDRAAEPGAIGAVLLERLDRVGDHLLLLADSIDLTALRLGLPGLILERGGGGLWVRRDSALSCSLAEALAPWPTLVVGRLGQVNTTTIHEALHLAFKGA